jgi:hypothetical protein
VGKAATVGNHTTPTDHCIPCSQEPRLWRRSDIGVVGLGRDILGRGTLEDGSAGRVADLSQIILLAARGVAMHVSGVAAARVVEEGNLASRRVAHLHVSPRLCSAHLAPEVVDLFLDRYLRNVDLII